jgi:hypothetical protein
MSLTTIVGYGARGLTALAALLAVSLHINGATASQTVGAERDSAAAPAPEVIWYPQNTRAGTRGTPVGLLYTPDTLAALVARQPPGRVSPRLTEAVRQRTPIVLMWSIPPSTDFGEAPRPFKVAITDPHQSPSSASPHQIEPLWFDQDAADLLRIDRNARGHEVGVIAAFPLTAFLPQRNIFIYAEEPYPDRPGLRVTTRNGILEWDGTAGAHSGKR